MTGMRNRTAARHDDKTKRGVKRMVCANSPTLKPSSVGVANLRPKLGNLGREPCLIIEIFWSTVLSILATRAKFC